MVADCSFCRDVRKIGELLRKLATNPGKKYTRQIVADRFQVPWPLLYMGSDSDSATLDWEH